MKITIVGGGSSAHTLIPMLSHCGHEVSLLTQRPNSWGSTVTCRFGMWTMSRFRA